MEFDFIRDPKWLELDEATKQRVLSFSFSEDIEADPKWSGLPGETQEAVRNKYFEDAKALETDIRTPETRGPIESVGAGLAHGVLGIGEAAGTGAQWLGNRLGIEPVVEAGEAVSDYFGKKAELFGPSKDIAGKNVWNNPELLADSTWWLYNVSDMVPWLAAAILPGAGTAKVIQAVTAFPKLASIGGTIAGGFFVGGGMEAAQTYKAVLEKGGTEEQAARSAELMWAGAGTLNAFGLGKILSKAGAGFKARVLKNLGAAAWEGITEGLEEPTEVFAKYFGAYLSDQPLPDNIKEQLVESAKAALTVAPIAGVVGGGTSILSGQQQADVAPVPPSPILAPSVKPILSGKIATAETADEAIGAFNEEIKVPSTAEETARTLMGDQVVDDAMARNIMAKYGMPIPPLAEKSAEEAADVFQEEFGRQEQLTAAETALRQSKIGGEALREQLTSEQRADILKKEKRPTTFAVEIDPIQVERELSRHAGAQGEAEERGREVRGKKAARRFQVGPVEAERILKEEERHVQKGFPPYLGDENKRFLQSIIDEGKLKSVRATPEGVMVETGRWVEGAAGLTPPYKGLLLDTEKIEKEIEGKPSVEPESTEPDRTKHWAEARKKLDLDWEAENAEAERRARLGKPGGIAATKIDTLANEAATSPENELPEPTQPQIEAGVYKKGHIPGKMIGVAGMNAAIENPRGSKREGVSPSGKPWSVTMMHHYGYWNRTEGADIDESTEKPDKIDVIIGPDVGSKKAFIVDQIDPETGKWDEHKTLVQFKNIEAARAGYLANYEPGWKGLGAITEVPIEEFKEWIGDGTRKEVPYSSTIYGDEGQILPGEVGPVAEDAQEAERTREREEEAVRQRARKGEQDLQLEEPEKPGGEERLKESWQMTRDDIESKYPIAKETVDGRTVRKEIPNQSSIDASVENSTILRGVREVSMDLFDAPPAVNAKTKALASAIKKSGEINPLIVVIDAKGPYVLEGANRYDAMKINGAKSIPALVVIDEDSFYEATKKAISEGKPIPPEVLADYPDLKPPAAPERAEVAAEGVVVAPAKPEVTKAEAPKTEVTGIDFTKETFGDTYNLGDEVIYRGRTGTIDSAPSYAQKTIRIIDSQQGRTEVPWKDISWKKAEALEKQPFEMTKAEWKEEHAFEDINPYSHEYSVKQAITEGKITSHPDYPELTAEAPKAPEKAVTEIERPTIKPLSTGKTATTYTGENEAIEIQYAFVDLSDIAASHNSDMTVNKDFPKELQPRERSRDAMRLQVESMANNLNPERLGESASVTSGAPIVGPDGVVESGNGRTIAISKAYEAGKAGDYKKWLEDNASRFGLSSKNIKDVESPILVRIRKTEINRAEFARKANQDEIARMSATEQAKNDADLLDEDDLELFRPSEDGSIVAAANQSFIDKFLAKLPKNESAALVTADGRLNKAGVDRIQAAIFQKAYNDDFLTSIQAEEADPAVKNIINALTTAAGDFARAAAVKGSEELDLSPHLSQAAKYIIRSRKRGEHIEKILTQRSMFDKVDELADRIARFFGRNIRSGKRIGTGLKAMARTIRNELINLTQSDMFEAKKPLTKLGVIERGIEHAERREETQAQQSLFEQIAQYSSRGREQAEGQRTEVGLAEGKISDTELKRPSEVPRFKQTTLSFGKSLPKSVKARPIPASQRVRVETTGFIPAAGNMVRNADEASSLLSHWKFLESAQEIAYTIAVDKNGKVLEIHKYSKGSQGASTVSDVEVAGRILNTPGAKKAYFVHNHPSGSTEASPEDYLVSSKIIGIAALGDVVVEPMIVAGGYYKSFNAQTGSTADRKTQLVEQTTELPEKERFLTQQKGFAALPKVMNSSDAAEWIENTYGGEEGILFVNSKNKPLDFIPYPKGMRAKDAAAKIVKQLELLNSRAIIINSKDEVLGNRSRMSFIRNISEAFPSGIGILDVISAGRSMRDNNTISQLLPKEFAEMTVLERDRQADAALARLDSEETLFSTIPGSAGITLDDVIKMFPGQHVGLSPDGSVWVRTQGGNGLRIEMVKQISATEAEFEAVYERMRKPGEIITGAYQSGTIRIQRDIGGRWVLAHESTHWMEDAGIINTREAEVLKAYIRGLVKKGEFLTLNEKDIGGKEDRAQFISDSLRERTELSNPIHRIIQKIADFIDGLVNLFTTTARGVVRGVETGRIYDRGDTPTKPRQITKEVWTLPITPEMKSKALYEGMPQFTFAGAGAITAETSELSRAGEMEAAGADMETIRKETGWFLNEHDNKWRFEIDDSAAKVDKNAKPFDTTPAGSDVYRLGDYIKHPDLYKAYPQLADYNIELLKGRNVTGVLGNFVKYSPTFKNNNPTIQLWEYAGKKSTLLHEIQHAVQEIEGFARGGSLETAKGYIKELENTLKRIQNEKMALSKELGVPSLWKEYTEVMHQKPYNYENAKAITDRIHELEKEPRLGELATAITDLKAKIEKSIDNPIISKLGLQVYRSLAGEIESRKVSARMDLTPEQRKAQAPFKDGIPKENVIVRFDKGPQFSTTAIGGKGVVTFKETTEPVTQADFDAHREMSTDVKMKTFQALRRAISGVKLEIEKTLTPISTRIARINKRLMVKVRNLDIDTNLASRKDLEEVIPLFKKTRKMSKPDAADWAYARDNSVTWKINELMEKYGAQKEYAATRKMIDSLKDRALDVGLSVGEIEDYWPRLVKDLDGLFAAMDREAQALYTRRIQDKATEMGVSVSKMNADIKAGIITNLILGGPTGLGGPTATKARKFKKIPPKLMPFYHNPDAALVAHIHEMNKAIEKRKFFGKIPEKVAEMRRQLYAAQAKIRKLNTQLDEGADVRKRRDKWIGRELELQAYINQYALQRDYTDNIGAYIDEMREAGEIDPSKEAELNDILKARFHERGTHGIVQTYKNFSYMDTMGSPISALTQIGDMAWAMYDAGIIPALKYGAISLAGRARIKKADVGQDRIAQEFADPGTLGKAVSYVFKLVGLEKIDAIGKEALLNASLERYQKEAKADPEKLAGEIKHIFEGETDNVIQDLLDDEITDNVKLLVYHRLMDFQPGALSEMPQRYLDAGNGRIFYMLKTFTIKQLDAFRNEGFHKIRTGNRAEKIQGIKNFTRLAMFFVLANAGADELKDWVLGRKTDLGDRVVDNILRLAGSSKFITWKARTEGVGSALSRQVLPPFKFIDAATKDIYNAGDDKGLEVLGSVPLVGKLAYWHIGRGVHKRGDLWDRRLRKHKARLTKIKEKYDRSKDKTAFMIEHRKDLAEHGRVNKFQGKLNKYRKIINKLKGREETPAILKRIGQLENRRTELIKQYLEK